MGISIHFYAFFSMLCLVSSEGDLIKSLFSRKTKFIELSQPIISNRTISFPGNQPFVYTRIDAGYSLGFWLAGYEFCTAEHAGTHMDAPYHFVEDGWTVGQIPIERMIAKLVVIDLREFVQDNADYVLQLADVQALLLANLKGTLENTFVIFRFGWSRFYNNRDIYLGGTDVNDLHFPCISPEVAQYMVNSFSNIVGVGVDGPSIDRGVNPTYPVHKILLGAGIYIIESINFNETNETEFKKCVSVTIVPKFIEGTGSAVRCVAICSI